MLLPVTVRGIFPSDCTFGALMGEENIFMFSSLVILRVVSSQKNSKSPNETVNIPIPPTHARTRGYRNGVTEVLKKEITLRYYISFLVSFYSSVFKKVKVTRVTK